MEVSGVLPRSLLTSSKVSCCLSRNKCHGSNELVLVLHLPRLLVQQCYDGIHCLMIFLVTLRSYSLLMNEAFYSEQNSTRVTYSETFSEELNCCLLNESYQQGNQ